MMYSNSALNSGGFDDGKIIFFGPSEQLVAEDEEIKGKAESLVDAIGCIAWKAISDKQGVSRELEGLGVKVEYFGSIVSELIKTGYVPIARARKLEVKEDNPRFQYQRKVHRARGHGFLDEIKRHHIHRVPVETFKRAQIIAKKLGDIIRTSAKTPST